MHCPRSSRGERSLSQAALLETTLMPAWCLANFNQEMLMMRLLVALVMAVLCVGITACGANTRSDGVSAAEARASELLRNKATARRVYEEGLSQGRFEVPYAAGFVGHGGATNFNHDAGIAEARGWRAAFPDLKVVVDLIIAEGDLVSVRWTACGTNTGAGNGIAATGKRVAISGTTFFRFVDGAIAEEWTSGDALGLMRQLGLMPQPKATT
jgi:predicted ester cyclase